MECYRVGTFETIGTSIRVQTYSRAPWNTDLFEILAHVTTIRDLGDHDQDESGRYRARLGVDQRSLEPVRSLLSAHRAPILTMVTDADVAIALDFYNVPRDGHFMPTAGGELMNRAKYGKEEAAREAIGAHACDLAVGHPLLAGSDLVVAMPGHQAGPPKPDSIPTAMAEALAQRLEIDVGALIRTRDVPERKNDSAVDIANSMLAIDVGGRRVLVVDDAARDGTTINEASRALVEAGAVSVYVLVAAKDWTGTSGYRPEDL